MPPRNDYPTSIPHRSWPVDRDCPLYRRMLGQDICLVSLDAKHLRPIPFGCDPRCVHRERALQVLRGEWDDVT